ncbi:MAG TPA: cell division protein ZapE [Stenotrophobium sp.]|jgi:cell division protein ZapE|nr:cell division protein ZapE [Stenotrophobium sp.]
MTPGPRARYEQDLQRQGFQTDPSQARAVDALQRICDELVARPPKSRLGSRRLRWPRVAGLYMWGGVGRGKTYLMDAFYESLPFSRKKRTHFHRFMLEVHELRKQFAHEEDPIGKVAAQFAGQVRVLCFDEFFVSDIADAMILARLFEVLFQRGVTLVATSNIKPDGLYKDGLQRQNFLPAIATLKRNVTVLNVDGGVDHRLRALTHAEIYHTPCDAAATADMERWFQRFAPAHSLADVEMPLNDRSVHVRRLADGVAWFEFSALCDGPRGTADYVEIARTHHTILLSHVPVMTRETEDPARRFVNLVDEFYDRGVKLIITADAPLEQIYTGTRLRFEFQRTRSRLQEMQSQEYLAQPHLP